MGHLWAGIERPDFAALAETYGRTLKMRILIVGGGITGLAAAWECQQRGVAYTLLESSDRLGGKIVTERTDGFVIEGAADSFLWQKPAAWQLARELGLADRIIGTNDAHRHVFVLHDGTLHPFPGGMRLIVPVDPDGLLKSDLLSAAGKQRMLDEVEVPPRSPNSEDESLASFIRRRFGEEALNIFGDSILSGIHVADPELLSMNAAYPNYVQLEREYGSVTAGMRSAKGEARTPDTPKTAFISFKTGMAELPEKLTAVLTGDVRTGQGVTRIDADGTVYTTAEGKERAAEQIHADAVILTVPSPTAAKLTANVSPELSHLLRPRRWLSSGTVSFGFRRASIDHDLDGFGFVVPAKEPCHTIAGTWSSTKLPERAPEGYVLLRLFFGGFAHESDIQLPNDALIRLARAELKQIMGIGAEPAITRVFRWREANPTYDVGHLERTAQIRAACPDWLSVAGCAYDGIGIPDCVRSGRTVAAEAISYRGA
jgi:oxygen-dependent protoporphyrinogen oxidase